MDHPEYLNEELMLLMGKQLGESVCYYLTRRHLYNFGSTFFNLLPYLVTVNVDIPKPCVDLAYSEVNKSTVCLLLSRIDTR